MAFVLKLYETIGATTLDFLATSGDPHFELKDGGLSIPAPKAQRVWGGKSIYSSGERLYEANYGNRTVSLVFAVHGSTRDKVAEGWRDIVRACQDIQNYAMDFAGNHWELQYAADGAADTTYFDPLDAIADLPGGILSTELAHWVDGDNYYVVHDCTLTLTCKPFARGDIVEMENLILNPSFEFWNSGTSDSQPDSWSDYEHVSVTGTNNRESTSIEHGLYSLQVDVTDSSGSNQYKGITQNITTTDGFLVANESYTLIAWVKNAAITNGVVRIEAYGTNTGSQYALNSGSANASFTRYAVNFTFHASDTTLTIRAYINSSSSNCAGTAYIDKMILLKGSFATDTTLAYMTSSNIVNHYDTDAGDVNFCDVADLPGDILVKAKMQLQLKASSGASRLKTFRVARRRLPTIFNLQNYGEWGEVTDSACSGSKKSTWSGLNTDWQNIDYHEITSNVSDTSGKFRILIRAYDAGTVGTLQLRSKSFIGVRGIHDIVNQGVVSPVASQWYIADLGVADLSTHGGDRYAENIGIAVQAKRTSGTEAGYLDYVLLMPLDGGYIVAKAPNALADGDDILFDGISDNLIVTSLRQSGTRGLPDPAGWLQACHSFNNTLYVAYGPGGATDGHVYSWDGDSWTDMGVVSAGEDNLLSLEDYEGELYCGTATAGKVCVYSGGSWSESYDSAATGIRALLKYKGKFFAGGYGDSGKIYEFNGTAWSVSYDSDQDEIECFGIFKDNLYAAGDATGNSKIFKFDGSSWSEAWDSGLNGEIDFLMAAHGLFYCGIGGTSANGGGVYKSSDGSSWSRTWDGMGAGAGFFAKKAVELNGILYVGLTDATLYKIISTADGTSWTTVSLSDLGHDSAIIELCLYNDRVCHIYYKASSVCYLYSANNLWTGIPDIVGRPLTLTPSIDQRLSFSFDRDDYVNNIDDYAYFRLYYEPQFLHVRVD